MILGTMEPRPSSAQGRMMGFLVLLFLVVDVALKDPADREEAMWACYWAAASVGVGILVHSIRLIAAGAIFLAGLGVPAWSVSILMDGKTEITSVLMHLIPLGIGLYAVTRAAEVPKHPGTLAWLLFGVPFALAWQFCDPAAAINLSHWTRWPVPALMPHIWLFYAMVLLGSAGLIRLSELGIRAAVTFRVNTGCRDEGRPPGAFRSGPVVHDKVQ